MVPAVIWLILGVLLIAAEVLSGEFVLLMLGGAALAAAGVSFVVLDSPIVGGVVFAVTSVLLLLAVRPALRRRLDRGVEPTDMHTRALVGNAAVVIARVDGHGGRVKIGGEVWSARAFADDDVIEEGTRVTVVAISGATALVVAQD
ncbi:NfeD family protein [Pseudonocardia nigra]|uniref:NfeD family protein n=1 Tax=Pseudonocardia nigra TaxID=1921578 RepID=UPI001C60696F|nr:NfeD family protein [Pseudonocardia nigra]